MYQTRLSSVLDFNGRLVTDTTQRAAHILYVTERPCPIRSVEIKLQSRLDEVKTQYVLGLKGEDSSGTTESLDTKYN